MKQYIRKAKGVKKNVIKKKIKHEQYKNALFKKEQMWHGMKMLRSDGHEIYGIHVNKISLSPFDSKRWIAEDGVNTKAYGYNSEMEEMEALLANTEIEEIELTKTEIEEIEALEGCGVSATSCYSTEALKGFNTKIEEIKEELKGFNQGERDLFNQGDRDLFPWEEALK